MADFDSLGLSAMGTTFAERKAAREAAGGSKDAKKVDEDTTENKAVKSASTKKKRPAPLKTVTRGR